MLMVRPHSAAATVRFSAANLGSSIRVLCRSAAFFVSPHEYRSCGRVKRRYGVIAAAREQSSSGSRLLKQSAKPQRYHPLEDIDESELLQNGEVRLRPAETTRTITEVNSKATLMFSDLLDEEIHENIFWPDLPYVTDEYGNIYFQVKNNKDILQSLTTEENIVQVIIGPDAAEMISEMEELGHSDFDFGMDEQDYEDSDFDDDVDDEDDDNEDEDIDEDDWVAILDEEVHDEDSDGSLGDWAELETMQSSHPLYFANKIAEVVSDDPVNCMDQRSAGLVIHGILRPAFVEEHSVIQKGPLGPESNDIETNHIAKEQMQKDIVQINGSKNNKDLVQDNASRAEELEKDETLGDGYAFYKLEMIKIQLISAHGDQNYVDIEDFKRARPDAIAHSAPKIIARLKAGGEKTMRALKSLCWRCRGIRAEECALIGVDSLGFDLRVCSGTQVQTLRFPFKKRAKSEYSAEWQLNDLLFPKAHKFQPKKAAKQTES
ncbi:hypothetical protein CDL12_07017 [Handroanthus impetiginosus]|uniref:Uncharacterized protein n=1 Tax=Handroanthus impetiginosus TaxID=429701 RepID=A0A2G9HS59_9LAMI|nr:hypothetical protein CDL12_07017 [Handroanthus impetiginosus]